VKKEKLKILTIVGTRPELIRLSCVIRKLEESFNHVLVHTSQNYDYELNEIFFRDLEIKNPKYTLKIRNKNFSEAVSDIFIKIDKILVSEKPDAVLVLGDTNSALSIIPAKRKKIPIFHMEAGNRCFDDRVPEEINRKIVDHTSDINLPYSSIAREHLINEGFPIDRVIKTGSPMFEVLNFYNDKINSSKILSKLKLKEFNFFLVSCHREENVDDEIKFRSFLKILNKLSNNYSCPIIVSTHPRTRSKIKKVNFKLNKNVKLLKPLSFSDYNRLQISSKLVLSDSGTINEESSILNFPALNIRDTYERQEAMEEGSVMMVGFNEKNIFNAINILKDQPRGKNRTLSIVKDYNVPNVSEKIVRIIISYVDYVKRNVWKEYS